MPSYLVAKDIFTETEKNRFLCLFLNSKQDEIDWVKATKEYGAASVESMKVSARTSLRKLEKAEAEGGVLETPKKSRSPKRKADMSPETTPAKKSRGRKKKNPVPEADDTNDGQKDYEDDDKGDENEAGVKLES